MWVSVESSDGAGVESVNEFSAGHHCSLMPHAPHRIRRNCTNRIVSQVRAVCTRTLRAGAWDGLWLCARLATLPKSQHLARPCTLDYANEHR